MSTRDLIQTLEIERLEKENAQLRDDLEERIKALNERLAEVEKISGCHGCGTPTTASLNGTPFCLNCVTMKWEGELTKGESE